MGGGGGEGIYSIIDVNIPWNGTHVSDVNFTGKIEGISILSCYLKDSEHSIQQTSGINIQQAKCVVTKNSKTSVLFL